MNIANRISCFKEKILLIVYLSTINSVGGKFEMTDKLNAENLKNYLGAHGGYLTKKDLKSDLTRQTFGVLLRPKETITDFLYLYDLKTKKLVDPKNLERHFAKYKKALKDMQGWRGLGYRFLLRDRYKLIQFRIDKKHNACYIVSATNDNLSVNGYVYFNLNLGEQHNIFFDTATVRKRNRHSGYSPELNIKEPLDFTKDNQILIDLPQLISAKDILSNIQNSNFNTFKTTINWSDCLNKENRLDALNNKWKRLKFLKGYVNLNKYDVFEISMLLQLKQKLSETEFLRFVNFYAQKRKKGAFSPKRVKFLIKKNSLPVNYRIKEQWLFMYRAYLTDRLNEPYLYNYYIVDDYCKNYLLLHPSQLECPFTSWDRFRREEIKLSHDAWSVVYKKKYGARKLREKLTTQPEWDKLKNNIRDTDLNLTLLDTGNKLVTEGKIQDNCVGTYYPKVRNNQSCILHYEDDKDTYTLEVANNGTKKKPKYTILQIYRKHDLPARDGVEAMLTTVLNR